MASWCANSLRDCQAWKDAALELSTTSNEAAKLFDALLRQIVSWSDCDALGGIDSTLKKMVEADPDAILPRAFVLGLTGLGTGHTPRVDEKFKQNLQKLKLDAEIRGNDREKLHTEAVILWDNGYHKSAAEKWEQILKDHPNDLMALKFAHDAYFFMGDAQSKRDSVKRVIDKWKPDEPCYSYLHGMLAFGLEECEEYREAEKHALQALSLNRFDCWATHARAHVLEMEARWKEGQLFMQQTENDWKPGWIIAPHNYWHFSLFFIEGKDFETPLTLFDNEINRRLKKSGSMLDMVDAVSLLWRLEMEGVNVGEKWREIPDMSAHLDDHTIVFNDVHFGPLLSRRGEVENENHLYESLKKYTNCSDEDNAKICQLVGLSLYEGMMAFEREKYELAAEKMLPIRQHIYRIGGSNAQRDIFTQTLIHACILSKNREHNALVETLLNERNKLKKEGPVSERLASKFRENHAPSHM
ncbi:hypothetical protein WR25_15211 [Diploscapter pachys]|uniref:Tetratricopeptide repeat protein 38 n=1 Tax=Diploscapter pachys TaxID=2018661 RepID=A0A2A2LUI0_9BILA|nr:hypothetical protein WR25_15211 [Diploscapter pachys]